MQQCSGYSNWLAGWLTTAAVPTTCCANHHPIHEIHKFYGDDQLGRPFSHYSTLPACLPARLPIHPSNYLSLYLVVHPSKQRMICTCIYLFTFDDHHHHFQLVLRTDHPSRCGEIVIEQARGGISNTN